MGYLDKLKAKADSNAAGELKMLPLAALEPSEKNFYRMCEIDALADSIAANGLEQNLVVKAEPGGKYRIITGHRRYQALLRLMSRGQRVETVPCIVRPAETEAQEMLRMIASNQYRELSDYEKMVQVEQATTAVKTLRAVKVAELGGIRLDGPTREVVSRLTGMSGPAVSKYAGIAEKLIPELKAKMEQGLLPFTVAYAACRYPAEWQRDMLEQHKKNCDAGPVTDAEVQGVALSKAVKDALYTGVSDCIDPAAGEAENVERLKQEWCRSSTGASIPGSGYVNCALDKITVTGAGNNWRVEMTPTRFVIVALGMWKELCTGNWKQEKERKRFKDVSREALERMDGELEELPGKEDGEACDEETMEKPPLIRPAGHLPPEGEGREQSPAPTDDPADTEESAVESGRFGLLRNELSGKSTALEDKAWDQIIVWNREKPTEDVYAVTHVTEYDQHKEKLAYYSPATDKWYYDAERIMPIKASTRVLGWFKMPTWEN